MATPNPAPTNPSQNIDLSGLKKGLKELLDDQGDYNNLLKDAIGDLRKLGSVYDKIDARVASLNKGTINTKELNKELYKL